MKVDQHLESPYTIRFPSNGSVFPSIMSVMRESFITFSFDLQIIAHAFVELECPKLEPQLARLLRHATINLDVSLRNRNDEPIDVTRHANLGC